MTRSESGSRRRPRPQTFDQSSSVVDPPSKIIAKAIDTQLTVEPVAWYNSNDLNPRGFFEYYLATPSPSISLGNRCPPPVLTPTVKGEFDQYFPSDIIRTEQLLEEGAALQSILWRRLENGERLTEKERERILNRPCFVTMLKQHKRMMAEEICELREPQTPLPSNCRPPITPEARQPCVPKAADVPRMPVRSPLSSSSLHLVKPSQSPVVWQKQSTDPQQLENLRSYTGNRAPFHQIRPNWPLYHLPDSRVSHKAFDPVKREAFEHQAHVWSQKERERRKRRHVETSKRVDEPDDGNGVGSLLVQAFRTLDDDHGGYDMPVTVAMRRRVES